METEFKKLLERYKNADVINNHISPSPVSNSNGREIVVIKKKSKIFKIVKYCIIGGIIITVITIICICIQRVRSTNTMSLPFLENLFGKKNKNNQDEKVNLKQIRTEEEIEIQKREEDMRREEEKRKEQEEMKKKREMEIQKKREEEERKILKADPNFTFLEDLPERELLETMD